MRLRYSPVLRPSVLTVPPFPQALEKYNIEKDIAAYIKKEFDKKYNPTWHCIVGRNFGARPPEHVVPPRPAVDCPACRPAARHQYVTQRPTYFWLARRLVRDARDEALHLLLPRCVAFSVALLPLMGILKLASI